MIQQDEARRILQRLGLPATGPPLAPAAPVAGRAGAGASRGARDRSDVDSTGTRSLTDHYFDAADGGALISPTLPAPTPASIPLQPGEHAVKIEREGFRVIEQKVVVQAGQSALLKLELSR